MSSPAPWIITPTVLHRPHDLADGEAWGSFHERLQLPIVACPRFEDVVRDRNEVN